MSYGEEPPPPWEGGFQRAPRQQGRRNFKPREKSDGPGDDYIEVKHRILEFYAKYPDGRIQTEVLTDLTELRVEHEQVTKWRGEGDERKQVTLLKPQAQGVITVQARVYRTPDDPRPCIGHSYLLMPGQTPYTEGSELENAETSAVGRALAMAGIAVQKGIASGNEIRTKGQTIEAELQADEEYRKWEEEQQKAQAATGNPPAQTAQAAAAAPSAPLESKHVPNGEQEQPAPAPVQPPPPQPVAADPATGEVLEGADAQAAAAPDGTPGLTAADLAGHMKAAGIGSVAVIAVAKEMFGHSNIRNLTDQQRGALWANCVERHSAAAGTQ